MFNTNILKSLKTIAIDSCKLRIPLSNVEILNPELSSYYADLNLESGEVDESTMKRRALLITENGIKTRYLIERKLGAVTDEYLVVLANAKLLKANYLKGINSDTVRAFYNSIIAHNIISLSYKDFLSAKLSDTDIKLDTVIEDAELRDEVFELLKSMTKFSQEKRGGVDFKKQQGNRGVQWGKREVANISHPHIKIYAKDLEMRHNDKSEQSTVLFVKSFNIDVIGGLTRLEGTIKNAKHFNSLVPGTSFELGELLKLSDQQLYESLIRMIQKHLEMDNKLKKPEKMEQEEKMSDKDIITFVALELLVENSKLKNIPRGINRSTMTPLQALARITRDHCDCRKQKSRIKSKINDLWFKYICTPEETERSIAWSKKHLGTEDEQVRTARIDHFLKLFTGLE